MSVPKETKAFILTDLIKGDLPVDKYPDYFKLETRPIPELKDGQILLKTLALSNDPAQRTWMSADIAPVRRFPQ